MATGHCHSNSFSDSYSDYNNIKIIIINIFGMTARTRHTVHYLVHWAPRHYRYIDYTTLYTEHQDTTGILVTLPCTLSTKTLQVYWLHYLVHWAPRHYRYIDYTILYTEHQDTTGILITLPCTLSTKTLQVYWLHYLVHTTLYTEHQDTTGILTTTAAINHTVSTSTVIRSNTLCSK